MTISTPRPGYRFWVAGSTNIGTEGRHGGSLAPTGDPNYDDDMLLVTTIEDLGGTFIYDSDLPEDKREYFEVLDVLRSKRALVVEASECPPFGRWREVEEWDVDSEPDW